MRGAFGFQAFWRGGRRRWGVGLLARHVARLRDPAAIVLAGHHDDRLEVGRALGATHTINTRDDEGLGALVADLTEGQGPEAVVDAVSGADSMPLATETLQPGGTVSRVGMEVFLGRGGALGHLLPAHVTIRGAMAPVRRDLPEVLSLLEEGAVDPSPVFTQDLALDEGAERRRDDGRAPARSREDGGEPRGPLTTRLRRSWRSRWVMIARPSLRTASTR